MNKWLRFTLAGSVGLLALAAYSIWDLFRGPWVTR